ncbi:MAG: FtsX-like permease family protein [Bacteroidales bacterium]
MTIAKYIFRSIAYYRKQHLVMFLAVLVTATVLTGALVIGDSVQNSLAGIVKHRLGNTRFVISTGKRYSKVDLSYRLSKTMGMPVTPVLILKGIAINQATGSLTNKASFIGIDSSFSKIAPGGIPVPHDNEAVINESIARKLNLKEGDDIIARIESTDVIPASAPFARDREPSRPWRLKVKSIATDDQLGRFRLSNDQIAPMNIFVSLADLGVIQGKKGLVNNYLIPDENSKLATGVVEKSLNSSWLPGDLGFSFIHRGNSGSIDLVSNRVFIDPVMIEAIEGAFFESNRIITYLVNDIQHGEKHTPYSFATAVPPTVSGYDIGLNEVLINQWTADDIDAKKGDSIVLTYFIIGPRHDIKETSRSFIVKDIIGNSGNEIDSTLVPAFEGLAGAADCRDWDAGIPVDLKRIRDKDEKYWDEYRGKPKVILRSSAGEQLWQNQFGSVTAIRFREEMVDEDKVISFIRSRLSPADFGITVTDVVAEGQVAAANSVDFTELFLSLSFFVIVAGLLLTVLVYSLNMKKRSQELSLMTGLGLPKVTVMNLVIKEAVVLVIAGSVAGSLLGVIYNKALMAGLNTVWNDIVRTDMLQVHLNPSTIITGAIASIIIGSVTIYITAARILRKPVAAELRIQSGAAARSSQNKLYRARLAGLTFIAIALLLVVYSISTRALESAPLFLSCGALLLAGMLILIHSLLLGKSSSGAVPGQVTATLLAIKSLRRKPGNSTAVISMLALGSFIVILTGSYHKTYEGIEKQAGSGSGGYLLWAETSIPVNYNLDSNPDTRRDIGAFTNNDSVIIQQFQRLDGDDASCLNLNQAQHPALLAVNPAPFDRKGAFSFMNILKSIPADHPWMGLDNQINDSTCYGFADKNVIKYSLKKKIGDTLFYRNETGKTLGVILAAALSNSIFQGYILVPETVFRRHFPSISGSEVLLVDAPSKSEAALTEYLSSILPDNGIEITPAGRRLAEFNSVENTYLKVFLALSGLGFLIGTIGLGIVLLRNVAERRREFALLLAIGYSRSTDIQDSFYREPFPFTDRVWYRINLCINRHSPFTLISFLHYPGELSD